MFRKWQFYFGANNYVEMTEGLDSSMLASLGQRRRRRLLTLLALVMVLLILAPWAAWNPAAFHWLSRVAPPLAQFLRPDVSSREANGFRVEFVETRMEGEQLLIHLTMEDTEGARLNGSSRPEHWTYEQGKYLTRGTCTQEYDPETGLLHLYLSCKPAADMPNFDADRWGTVTLGSLRTTTAASADSTAIPLDRTDGTALDIPLPEDRAVVSITAKTKTLHIQVRESELPDTRPYSLVLSTPAGAQITHYQHTIADGISTWSFSLGGRDLRELTLTAYTSPARSLGGTWSVPVGPAAG